MKKILVTGAGAVLGQGIIRCLRASTQKLQIHTCDPDWRSSGHWLGDKAHLIPFAADDLFIDAVVTIVKAEEIDLILVGTDAELPKFSENKEYIEKHCNAKLIISSKKVIEIANDKWLTAEFLRENGFSFPLSALTSDVNAINALKKKALYPYIAKPIDGARSKGIFMVEDEQTLNEISLYKNNLVVQEYLSENEGEFTTGCVVYGGECKAIVTLKRDLRDGNTYRAYYESKYNIYNSEIKKIAEALDVEGPCNFQFRIRDNKPVIFEINARFSGTTPIRHVFGFNEVEAIIEYISSGKEITSPNLKPGIVMRAWSDIFIQHGEAENFSREKVLDHPKSEYFPFKN